MTAPKLLLKSKKATLWEEESVALCYRAVNWEENGPNLNVVAVFGRFFWAAASREERCRRRFRTPLFGRRGRLISEFGLLTLRKLSRRRCCGSCCGTSRDRSVHDLKGPSVHYTSH